jgi:hypoxanthine phosphoribosyltransferase
MIAIGGGGYVPARILRQVPHIIPVVPAALKTSLIYIQVFPEAAWFT